MKKILTAALSAIILVTSCQKALDTKDITPTADGTITLSVNASLPDYDNATKGSLVNTVRLAWSEGDAVYVYDNEKCLGTLTASLEEGTDKYAVLSGTINSSVADKLTLVVASEEIKPSVATQGTPIQNGITFDLSTQDQTGAPYVAYTIIDNPANSQVSGIKTAFQLATSVIKVNCTGTKSGTPVSKVRIKGVNTELKLVPNATEAPSVSSYEGSGMITRTNATSFVGTNGEGIMSFSVAVLQQAATADRKIYVSQEGFPCSASFSAAALTKGLSYNTVAQVCGPYKTVGGHSGVRLWADGPYWATCNIGAESPTDNGYYYMWGSTQAYEYRDMAGEDNDGFYKAGTDTKIAEGGFCSENYTEFGICDVYNHNTFGFNKYTGDATGGDGRTRLEPIDDAAVIEWGSGWRMPTGGEDGEFQALVDNCDWTLKNTAPKGCLVTGKGEYAGISVFFPDAGYGEGNSLVIIHEINEENILELCHYWSSCLGEPLYSFHLSTLFNIPMGYMNISQNTTYRYQGLSVRPVLD